MEQDVTAGVLIFVKLTFEETVLRRALSVTGNSMEAVG